MTKRSAGGARPPRLTISAADHKDLLRLTMAASHTMPEVAALLGDEIERAHVLPKGRNADNVVCMGSVVEFRDDTTGRTQMVTLAYPGEADIAKGKISVLTPIGTALIGLPVGKSITWETRNGDERRLTVLQVREAEPV